MKKHFNILIINIAIISGFDKSIIIHHTHKCITYYKYLLKDTN